jgi:hypothetical protein
VSAENVLHYIKLTLSPLATLQPDPRFQAH